MAAERKGSIEIFKVAGIQVAIDYSWLVIFALILWSLASGYFPGQYPGYSTGIYWLVGLVATILFFGSVLAHELCHAAMGNRLGEEVHRITLFIFGGMAELEHEPKSGIDELKIAAVGPLSSLVMAGIFWLIARGIGAAPATVLWKAVFSYLAFINLALALFNLLPGFPLDGGRLLRAALWMRWGDLRRATAAAADWGNTIAWGLIALGAMEIFAGALVGGLWLIFIGLFLRSAASSGYQSMIVEQALSGARVGEIMVRDPIVLGPDETVADAIENYFLRYGFGGFPVAADGKALGVVTLAQVRDCPASDRVSRRISGVMRPAEGTIEIAPGAGVIDAIRQMVAADIGRLLVVEQGKLVGLITRTGVTRYVHTKTQLSTPARTPAA
ncbi:site-2 protease family protein [Candidatus Binatus sp.]|uniref:site-2 protease family protein n=1 Tax=Candidatus Binatus sp. TaxID=2811406 RepID=UPI002F95C2CD